MKNVLKRFLHLGCAAIAGVVLVAGSASAVPISGTINFTGALTLTGPGSPVTVTTATGVDFLGAAVGLGNTGDFAAIPAFSTAATFKNFTFNPSNPVNDLWTVVVPGVTYGFDLVSINSVLNGSFLNLSGDGWLKATGFENTWGAWLLSTQGNSQILTFSATSASAPVPEPGTLLLLGSGLVGLAWYGRKRKQA